MQPHTKLHQNAIFFSLISSMIMMRWYADGRSWRIPDTKKFEGTFLYSTKLTETRKVTNGAPFLVAGCTFIQLILSCAIVSCKVKRFFYNSLFPGKPKNMLSNCRSHSRIISSFRHFFFHLTLQSIIRACSVSTVFLDHFSAIRSQYLPNLWVTGWFWLSFT